MYSIWNTCSRDKIVCAKKRKFCFTSFSACLDIHVLQMRTIQQALCHTLQFRFASVSIKWPKDRLCLWGWSKCRDNPIESRKTDCSPLLLPGEQLPSPWKISQNPSMALVVCLSFLSPLHPLLQTVQREDVSSVLTTHAIVLRNRAEVRWDHLGPPYLAQPFIADTEKVGLEFWAWPLSGCSCQPRYWLTLGGVGDIAHK